MDHHEGQMVDAVLPAPVDAGRVGVNRERMYRLQLVKGGRPPRPKTGAAKHHFGQLWPAVASSTC